MLKLKEIRVKKGLTQKQIANKIGIGVTTYSGYETGYSNPDIDKLMQISDILGVTIDFLVGHESLEQASEPKQIYSSPTKGRGAPYYDVDFIGGFDIVFSDQSIQPTYFIDFPPFNNVDCWINVTGKSMSPLIEPGDMVALIRLKDNSWKNFIVFGEIYAIVTDQFRTIKVVAKGKDDDHFNLIPHNKDSEFSEQQIPIKLITFMFQVKGSIKKFS